MVKLKLVALFCVCSILFSCREKRSSNPIEVYKYWAGSKPENGVKVIHGKYWESSHWSKEYIMYLEIEASAKWRSDFISQNHLVQIWISEIPPPGPDVPEWFKPDDRFKIWTTPGMNQGSIYFEDSLSNRMFLHEVQL